jgi:putative serine protease PepD
MPVLGTPPSDEPPPRSPRHLWTGDWLSESERARRAAEQAAAELERATAEREAATSEMRAAEPEGRARSHERVGAPGAARPRRRLPSIPALVAIVLVVAGLAFGAGYLLVGDDTPDPLPAVSGEPIKPRKGQTRATAVYAKASPAVVSIRAGGASGTGFLTDGEGQIVTNAHVVSTNKRVTVKFGDGASVQADVLGTDPSTDLAVLSIPKDDIPKGVKPLQFADSRSVQVGDLAIAIGNPFGLDRTATEGIISGIGRSIEAPNGFSIDQVIQTDAPINPGNSGGPLLDDGARVIGVNSQIATAGSPGNVGVGFAVPSNTVRQVVPRLARGESIDRGYLGVATRDTTSGRGAEVESTVPGGPGDRAGLLPGDVIKKVDGEDVKESADVAAVIATRAPGDDVEIEVDRGGSTQKIDAELGNRPAKTP